MGAARVGLTLARQGCTQSAALQQRVTEALVEQCGPVPLSGQLRLQRLHVPAEERHLRIRRRVGGLPLGNRDQPALIEVAWQHPPLPAAQAADLVRGDLPDPHSLRQRPHGDAIPVRGLG